MSCMRLNDVDVVYIRTYMTFNLSNQDTWMEIKSLNAIYRSIFGNTQILKIFQ